MMTHFVCCAVNKGPSIHYVSFFLGFFEPLTVPPPPLCKDIFSTQVRENCREIGETLSHCVLVIIKMYYKVKTFTIYKLYIKAQLENSNRIQQLSSWHQT